eukprot:c10602_g1_i1.p1 GENE.c10602_g1_i1~~c10602_g1_i1.p1  ORF type:complete len:842 (+),score=224.08 c10602_g1_i1:50-2527(+)
MVREQAKNGRARKAQDMLSKIKDIAPHLSDDEIRVVIDSNDGDEDKIEAWLARQIDERESWSKVSVKASKKAQATKPEAVVVDQTRKARPRARPAINRSAPPNLAEISVSFLVPKSKHPALIGPMGKTIQNLQSEAAVRVFVPDRDHHTSLVTVVGEPQNVEQARKTMEKILEMPISSNSHRFVMEVPNQFRGKKISLGPLEARFACAVHVPRMSTSSAIIIEGPTESVHLIKSEIGNLLKVDGAAAALVPLPTDTSQAPVAQQQAVLLGNLPTQINNEAIEEFLKQAGDVSEVVRLKQVDDQRSQQALASFKSAEGAAAAIRDLHQTEFQGKSIRIVPAPLGMLGLLMPVLGASPQRPSEPFEFQNHSSQRYGLPPHSQLPLASEPVSTVVEPVEVDPHAAATAADLISRMTTHPDFDLRSALHAYPLPTANSIQVAMRRSLAEQISSQNQAVGAIQASTAEARTDCEILTRKIQQTQGLHADLKEQLRLLQQKIAATEHELGALEKEQRSKQQIVNAAGERQAFAAKNAKLFVDALSKTQRVADQVSKEWNGFLASLNKGEFESWSKSDLGSLLVCLDIAPDALFDAGIEPAMLSCIEDNVLKQITLDDRPLSLGQRRTLLVAVRGLLMPSRTPTLDPEHPPTRGQLVALLMQWGLKLTIPVTPGDATKHPLLWTVDDVVDHFGAAGLPECGDGLRRQHVTGAVLLTLSRRDCFSLELDTLGDTIQTWKEAVKLQLDHMPGASKPSQWRDDVPAWTWTVDEVAKFFEARGVPELGRICATQRISGDVLLCLERTDDLMGIEFAKPADRIKMLQLCKLALSESK